VLFAKEAKARQTVSPGAGRKGVAKLPPLSTGKARDKAAKAVGVSGRTIVIGPTVSERAVTIFRVIVLVTAGNCNAHFRCQVVFSPVFFPGSEPTSAKISPKNTQNIREIATVCYHFTMSSW